MRRRVESDVEIFDWWLEKSMLPYLLVILNEESRVTSNIYLDLTVHDGIKSPHIRFLDVRFIVYINEVNELFRCSCWKNCNKAAPINFDATSVSDPSTHFVWINVKFYFSDLLFVLIILFFSIFMVFIKIRVWF